ncbi:hypothetical protein [Vibrio sp. D431a]|uniref:hypothetical protein n=1 Tax=Vibrio sp. D431a TaxID=2837388 RepID=UPI0025557B36|nr:hypothetical protein [Vibrio sp. D431a]MDK9793734.1 hypothetical protein [Vibrio sp. D431a]
MLIFNSLYQHKAISELLPNCTVIAAGRIDIEDDGTLYPTGYSTTLRIGSKGSYEVKSANNTHSGVFATQGNLAFLTDNPKALTEALESKVSECSIEIPDKFTVSVSAHEQDLAESILYSLNRLF